MFSMHVKLVLFLTEGTLACFSAQELQKHSMTVLWSVFCYMWGWNQAEGSHMYGFISGHTN